MTLDCTGCVPMLDPGEMPTVRSVPSTWPPTAAEFVGTGFKGGIQARPLLDVAFAHYGKDWLSTAGAQAAVVAACFDEAMFTFGRRREQQFLRILMDEVDRLAGFDVAEELTMAACLRSSAPREELPYLHVQIGSARIRVSALASDVSSA